VHWDTLQQQRLSNLARAPLHTPAGSGLLIGSTSLLQYITLEAPYAISRNYKEHCVSK
jgi:hypothetical protein